MNLCECGCGQYCKNRFVRYHQNKIVMSKETRKKISKAKKGKKLSEEHKQNIKKGCKGINKGLHKGVKQTDDHIEKRVVKLKGKKRNQIQKNNISNALKGKEKSEEHKNNLWINRKDFKHSEETKKQISETCKKTLNDPELIKQMWKTKKKNNTLNTSKPEKELLKILEKKYPDVKFQYRDEIRYPYSCDFYIPSIDLFIEYNGTWLHGKEPYNPTIKEHQILLKKWKEKDNKFYKKAITIWTIKDVEKRELAKKNKLNYLEIASKKEENRYNYILEVISEYKLNNLYGYFCMLGTYIPNFKLEYSYDIKILEKELMNYYHNSGYYNSRPLYNRIVLNFQSTFYKEEKELWKDIEIKEKVIKNRVKYLNKSEKEVTTPELLSGFKKSGIYYGYSHFSPYWIKTFIKEYKINSILDICGGWGHRYLGSLHIPYIYNDCDSDKYRDMIIIDKFCNSKIKLPNKIFLNKDCSTFKFNEKYDYDCVFTCPPYFDTELYNGQNDSYNQYSNYNDWLGIWWRKSIKNSIHNKLRYFAFIISNKYKEDMIKICKGEGLELKREIKIGNKSGSHLSKNIKNQEYLIILV